MNRGVAALDPLLAGRYFLADAARPDAVFAAGAEELAAVDGADRLLRVYAPLLKAWEPAVAAAYFAGWFRAIGAAVQRVVSCQDGSLDVSLSNLVVEMYPRGGYYAFSFRLLDAAVTAKPAEQSRDDWRASVWTRCYGDTMRPVLEAMAAAGNVPIGLLWGQVATGMQYYHEVEVADAEDPAVRQRLVEDYDALAHGVPPTVFGRKRNPFDIRLRWVPHPREPDKQIWLKPTCCLAYRTDFGYGFCDACPRNPVHGHMEETHKGLAHG